MHFVGMLGLRLSVAVSYDAGLVALSVLVAVAAVTGDAGRGTTVRAQFRASNPRRGAT